MHQQFLDIGTVRLVRWRVQSELHRADDAAIEFRGEQHGRVARDRRDHFLEECRRIVTAERQHEVHRRAAFDAIGEHVGELPDRGFGRAGIEDEDFGICHLVIPGTARSAGARNP